MKTDDGRAVVHVTWVGPNGKVLGTATVRGKVLKMNFKAKPYTITIAAERWLSRMKPRRKS